MKCSKLSTNLVIFYIVYTAMVVTSGGVFDGQFAFGAFVGALYAGNPFVVSLLYLASGVVYGWSNLLQCAVKVAD